MLNGCYSDSDMLAQGSVLLFNEAESQ